ncbi:MAG: carbon-nitrogen hydrolase family protein [Sphingomonadales bacterium]|jgi:predicted amidohydrolase|nr:carbon-nitrogen hydrolase family protein [Sphingomonadales bacterium]MBK6719594.1 carbon-nitrogen hydrolase family protein [Sphingomonadales bacterium]MBK9999773.1 carbon-nitrogen hydrolase family protein [Sphingomonadales bacterium]
MRIALAQMQSGIDPRANSMALVEAIEAAAKGGAAMLFTPEMSGLLDRNRGRAGAHIVPEDQDIVLADVRKAAADYGIWVSLGSLALQGGSGGRLVNRSFLIDATGAVRARYDKIHLFDVDLPTGESWRESAAYAPGKEAVVADAPVGRLGLSICYDLRFPALYAAMSAAGATILSIPAAFTVPTGKAHWHVLMRARAIENAAWVVSAAQVGTHEDGRTTYGHSLVVDPWGEIVLDMGEQVGVGFAELGLSRCDEVRVQIPVLSHRRQIPEALVAG